MALLALANYLLVLFDLSYIPLRDFWLQGRVQLFLKVGPLEQAIPRNPLRVLPFSLTPWYDWVKGIEPHRTTEAYLEKVNALNEAINQNGLQPDTLSQNQAIAPNKDIDRLLKELRDSSQEMIDSDPFAIANKTGTLERIKNKMRSHIFGTKEASSTQAFNTFWSRDYLAKHGYRQELDFFNRQIVPLIATNYYRPVGENGRPVDNFGLLDFPFSLIFFVEFLSRTWIISRRHAGLRWFDAMLWRWYDIFLFIPVFRWLRIIPVTIRLHQARLIDLAAIQRQASQGFVASIAEDLTEVVILQAIAQVQGSIQNGALRQMLTRRVASTYIDLNETNEVTEIVRLMAEIVINRVLPQVQPDIAALLNHAIERAIVQSPSYATFQNLPGFQTLQLQVVEKVTQTTSQAVIDMLQGLTIADPQFDVLLEKLTQNFQMSLNRELQSHRSLDRLENLIDDLLEEVKVNFIQRLSSEDVEGILEQARQLRQKSLPKRLTDS
jgi:hypothetical protein